MDFKKVQISPKFLTPFVGKPTPIPLSGLFLFSPSVFLGIAGLSMSGIFRKHESLYKRLKAVTTGKKKPSIPEVRNLMLEMFDTLDFPAETKAIWVEKMEADIAKEEAGGGAEFEEALSGGELGEYQAVMLGANIRAERKYNRPHQVFLLELEQASLRAQHLLHHKLFLDAKQEILGNDFLKTFLWPEVRVALEQAQTTDQFLLIRALVALEVHLAYLAVLERYYESEVPDDTNALMSIWPRLDKPLKNPTALLFEWVKEQVGVKTISAFFNHPKLTGIHMEMVTLKRWNNGSHHPNREWLGTLADALFGDEEYPPFWCRHELARVVNFIGYVHQSVVARIEARFTEEQISCLAPWPNLPHNYQDFATWGRERYPHWRSYACDYQAKVKLSQACA